MLGGAAGAILPINFWTQTSGSFDAPFTAAAFVGLCICICRIRVKDRFTWREGVTLGIAVGLGCLLSPAILPAIIGWLILFGIGRRRQPRQLLMFFAAIMACFVAVLTPWAIRNYQVLGSPIWSRSNFWLEIHASNNDWMTADEEKNVRMPQFALVHPYFGGAERAEVKRLGEVSYMHAKRKQALDWIWSHKRRFLQLTAERFRLFWFSDMRRPLQTIGEAVLTVLGLSGLVLLFRSRISSAWVFGSIFVLYPPVYYLIQVTPRYRLPLEPFLFLLAGYSVFQAGIAMDRKWRKAVSLSTQSRSMA